MRKALRMPLPKPRHFDSGSARIDELWVENAANLIRRINQCRNIKATNDFVRALNGCLYIYYFTYHATGDFLPEEDTRGIGDTIVRDTVAGFSGAVIRRCSTQYRIPIEQLLSWEDFYS